MANTTELQGRPNTINNNEESTVLKSLQVAALLAASALPISFRSKEAEAAQPIPAAAEVFPGQVRKAISAYLTVKNVSDLVNSWSRDQNLYVQGDIGLSASQLRDLSGWLRENHPNWTVYLSERAEGENYRDRDGNKHHNTDAVEFALGHELYNTTQFGSIKDPRTAEPSGNIIYITFDKQAEYRRVGYYASQAYDSRGLGEHAWKGDLDQLAIRPLKEGRRIVDAVKGPITEIDTRLSKQIALEQTVIQEKIAQVESKIELSKQHLALLEVAAKQFRMEHPSITGDLARIDLISLKKSIKGAERDFSIRQYDRALTTASSIGDNIVDQLEAFQRYQSAPEIYQKLRNDLVAQSDRPHGDSAKDLLQEVNNLIATSEQHHKDGNVSYHTELKSAESSLEKATSIISSAESRQVLLHNGLTVLVFAAILGTCAAGYIANRRRYPLKKEAEEILVTWERALNEKLDRLYELDQAKQVFVGDSSKDLNLSGETKQLAHQILENVGKLFILQGSAKEVLKQAEKLIHPSSIVTQLKNLFQSGRFQEGIDMLKDQPITFDPESGLEIILKGSRDNTKMLAGDLEDYEPFTLTFDELLGEFNARAIKSATAIKQIEQAKAELMPLIEQQTETQKYLASQITLLDASASKDGLFIIDRRVGEILNGILDKLSKAQDMSISDPVGAFKVVGSQTAPLDAIKEYLETVVNIRFKELNDLVVLKADLASQNPEKHWIDQDLKKISSALIEVGRKLTHKSNKVELSAQLLSVYSAVEEFGRKCLQIRQLTQETRDQFRPKLLELNQDTAILADQIAVKLGISKDQILSGWGVSANMLDQKVSASLKTLMDLILAGELEGSQQARERTLKAFLEFEDYIRDTRQALTGFGLASDRANGLYQTLNESLKKSGDDLLELERDYSKEALLIREDRHNQITLRALLVNAIDTSEKIADLLKYSLATYQDGRVVEAQKKIDQVVEAVNQANLLLQTIDDHKQALAKKVSNNSIKSKRLSGELSNLKMLLQDSRTTQEISDSGITFYESSIIELKKPVPRPLNPESRASNLQRLEAEIASIRESINQSWASFSRVGEMIVQSEIKIRESEDLLKKIDSIEGDFNIRDSKGVKNTRNHMARFRHELSELSDNLKGQHLDWGSLAIRSERLANIIGKELTDLKDTVDKAKQAIAGLEKAEKALRKTKNWRGRYGVSISGRPGESEYEQSQRYIELGMFAEAISSADKSRKVSEHAVNQAESEVARHTAAELASRQAYQSNNSSYDYGSSSSSSSGFDSSSFSGGSDSGFSSSGW